MMSGRTGLDEHLSYQTMKKSTKTPQYRENNTRKQYSRQLTLSKQKYIMWVPALKIVVEGSLRGASVTLVRGAL